VPCLRWRWMRQPRKSRPSSIWGNLRLFRREAQAHQGQDRRPLAHLFGVLAGARDHEQPVIRVADKTIVAQAFIAAGGPLARGAAWPAGDLGDGTVALMEGKQPHPRLTLRSDSEGEFGEGSREPMPWIGIKAEFVAAAAKILDEGVPGADHLC
jgi:hypothetical protein